MTQRLLVVHTGGIGDFLLCCPSIQALSRMFRVELLGRPDRLALAIEAGIAQKAHDIGAVGFESLFAAPNAAITSFPLRFRGAVVWMRDDDGALKRSLRSCGVPDAQVFPGLPPDDWDSHASEYYVKQLGLDAREPFRLALAGAHRDLDVVVHPGSGGNRKNWPMDRFLSLTEQLQALGRRVHWCLGPAEEHIRVPSGAERLATSCLTELARRLSCARAYVGNDSGITHLAAACGVPTTAIFGPTDPQVWAPRGRHVRVVQGEPWPGVEAVLRSLIIV